jgi:hypothetical protein
MTDFGMSGLEKHHDITPSSITNRSASAFEEIRRTAINALLGAAEEIVKPAAVKKAPLLVDVPRAGTGHGPHADPAKYQGGAEGELRASAHVVDERESDNRVGVAFDTPYASLQHERMDWKHEVGEAKYLENAMWETHREVVEHVANKCREVTGG